MSRAPASHRSVHSTNSRRAVVGLALVACMAMVVTPTTASAQRAQALRQGPVDLEGELDVIVEDADTGSRLLYFLHTKTDRLPLRFRTAPPELPSGTRIRVRGDLAEGSVTTTTVTTIAVSPSRTIGQQDVLVILMNFLSNPVQPYSQTTAINVNSQVRNFYLENSYGQTSMSFIVTPWLSIAGDTSTCAYSTWAGLADAEALARGYDRTLYDRVIYAFPSVGACGWWGLGNVSGPRSWINGSYALRVVAHELGHNFGDYHSHASKCDSTTGCASVEYGDDRDVMGAPGVTGHLNAFQKERLGWLNYGVSPTVLPVSTSGSYWIDAYETPSAGIPKGLKIWNPVTSAFLYVEARTKTGFDANVATGVTLRTGSPTSASSSFQLDLAPSTTTWDSTLDLGQSFTDPSANVTLKTLSADATGAMVEVTFGPVPCVNAAPSVSLSPSSQTGAAGGTFQYSLSVTNNNSSGCAASPVTLAAAVPSGWTASISPATLSSLAPGATVSPPVVVSVTSPSDVSGPQRFTVSATDATSMLAASTDGSVNLLGPLTVTASAVLNTSGKTRSAMITVGVQNGSTPLAGAAVTVTVTKPTGAVSTLTATTSANGTATLKYSLGRKDPSGTYSVRAVGNMSGATGSATTSFVVP